MASVKKKSSLLPPLANRSKIRNERLAQFRGEIGKSGKAMDLNAIRARREHLEEMANARRGTVVGKRAAFSKAPSYTTPSRPISSIKLAPIELRVPNELDRKRQNSVLKRPKSSHKTTVPAEKHETWKDEQELLDLWKRQNKLSDLDRKEFDPSGWVERDNKLRGRGKKRGKSKEVTIKEPEKEEIPQFIYRTETASERTPESSSSNGEEEPEGGDEKETEPPALQSSNNKIEDIRKAIEQMKTMTDEERLVGAFAARKHLSSVDFPPIQEYIDEGALPPLINCLKSANPSLQFEACWAITNISSGTSAQAKAIYEAGGIPVLVGTLESPYSRVSDQSVWAIGNLVGDSELMWQKVVEAGCIKFLHALIDKSPSLTALRNLSWTFSNILRYKNMKLSPQDLKLCIKALRVFIHHPDKEIHLNTLWSFVYLTDIGTTEVLNLVIQAGVLPRLVEFLENKQTNILLTAIKVLGSIMTGTAEQTDQVIAAGIIPFLVELLNHSVAKIRKDSAWALSNITGGTEEQIQLVVDTDAVVTLIQILDLDSHEVCKEAGWALSNLTGEGSQAQIDLLNEKGAVRPLAKLILDSDTQLVQVVLEALLNILQESSKPMEAKITILDVVKMKDFEKLASSDVPEISKLSSDIIEKLTNL